MSESEVFPVPEEWAKRTRMDAAAYEAACRRADADPEGYWRDVAARLDWIAPPSQIRDVSFDKTDFRIRWYADGILNVSVNCLDRHLETRGDQTAIIWESDDPEVYDALTYRQLHAEVCRWANVLKAKGVKKGDRVTVYLRLEDGVVRDFSFQGSGCAIATAAASMMGESVKGKTAAEAAACSRPSTRWSLRISARHSIPSTSENSLPSRAYASSRFESNAPPFRGIRCVLRSRGRRRLVRRNRRLGRRPGIGAFLNTFERCDGHNTEPSCDRGQRHRGPADGL